MNDFCHLAPMEGVTDFPTRLWFAQTSAPYMMGTPFLRVTSTYPGSKLPISWAPEIFISDISKGLNYEVTPQLMCPLPELFIEQAPRILKTSQRIEINCGCPSPKVVGKSSGSALLRETKEFHNFIKTLCQALPDNSLSVKMRTGYHTDETFYELTSPLSELPLNRLVVHGRTRAQRYTGKANWQHMDKLSRQFPFPVVGSGDVVDFLSLQEKVREAPQVASVMIGRGALRNPWIFKEIKEQRKQALPIKTLLKSLEVYGLLVQLYSQKDEELLFELIGQGHWQDSAQLDEDKWSYLQEEILKLYQRKNPTSPSLEMSRTTLGRLKLLWNYLRSSLPTEYWAPQVLRAKTFEELKTAIVTIKTENCRQEPWPHDVSWNPTRDWLYSGEPNPNSKINA